MKAMKAIPKKGGGKKSGWPKDMNYPGGGPKTSAMGTKKK